MLYGMIVRGFQAQDLYYTLEQAQSGFITEEEILSHATAIDREDGSPILPGNKPAQVIRRFHRPDPGLSGK